VLLGGTLLAGADFDAANKLYESGKYAEAVTAYRAVIENGNKSAEAYYNLGNAYFKDKKTGFAILNYEKALKISPRDADIKYNLEFARSFIKETAVADTASKILGAVYYFLTLNELCLLLSFSFILLIGLIIYRRFRKNELSYWLNFSFALLFGLLFVFGGFRIYEKENTKYAVVTSASVEARAAPLETNPASFTLPEGKKVVILNSRRDWVEVLLPAENIKGWVKAETVSGI
ncbi:MAG: tetratricopeptide repeat protein, partial [Candidatus Firestonebacteria bacterium]